MLLSARFSFCVVIAGALLFPAPASPQPDQDQLASLTAQARQAQDAGDFDAAIQSYTGILRIRPNWGPAEFNLGLMYHMQKKYADAVPLFTRALQHDPTVVPAWLFRGIGEYNLGRYRSSADSLEHFLRVRPDDQEAHFFLGGAYFALGDYAAAARQYTAQLKLTKMRADVYYQLAECYIALARAQAKYLVEDPKAKYFSILLHAQAFLDRKNFSEAEAQIRDALRLRPAGPEALICLGRLYAANGQARLARTTLQQALQSDASNCDARAALAQLDGRPAPSCASVTRVANKPPGDPAAAYTAIRLYIDKAQQLFAELTKMAPQSALIGRMQAQTSELQSDFETAETAYQTALSRDPNDPDSYLEYGRFKARLNQFDGAISLLKKALAIVPYNPEANALLGDIYALTEKPDEAIAPLRIVIKERPGDARSRVNLAQALAKVSQVREAIVVLEGAPEDPDGNIHFVLSGLYRRQGRAADAAAALKIFQSRRNAGR